MTTTNKTQQHTQVKRRQLTTASKSPTLLPTKTKEKTITPTKTKEKTTTPTKTRGRGKNSPTLNKTAIEMTAKNSISPKLTDRQFLKIVTNEWFRNQPEYEYDVSKNRWVLKSDLRPLELVNRYKKYLIKYLKTYTNIDRQKIEKLVNKHATSTERLKKLLVEDRVITESELNQIFKKVNFWRKELCHHMKKICPTETDLSGIDWCEYPEEGLYYFKDDRDNKVSCFSVQDIYEIISSSFTGESDDGEISLQLPRDPYTRKIFTKNFIKKFLKHLRRLKADVNNLIRPHVVYFLRNYEEFYEDPQIKPFLTKNTLTKKEKRELSEAIEDFLTETEEIEHGWTTGPKRWWFWVNEKNKPTNLYAYIFKT